MFGGQQNQEVSVVDVKDLSVSCLGVTWSIFS